MRNRPAFTIVELTITLVVMAILMTLAVVSFKSAQVSARDTEREADVKAIARGLEQRYKEGNTVATATTVSKGAYPGINEMLHMFGQDRTAQGFTPGQVSGGYLTLGLPGTTDAVFLNPSGQSALELICSSCTTTEGDATQLNTAFNGQDRYVYEPIQANNTVCSGSDCRRFNIYWKKEADGNIQKVRSLNRQ